MRHPLWAIAILLLTSTATALAGTGEFTIAGAQVSGDFGGETESDTQSTLLRFLAGEKTQIRAELGLLRVRSNGDLAVTHLGRIPGRGQGPQNGSGGEGSGPGSGSSGQGTGSEGTGSGASTPTSTPTDVPSDQWNTGLGDLRLTVSRRILGGGAKIFQLATEFGVKLPTGDEDKNLGTGEMDLRVALAGNYRFWSLTGFAGVGWNSLGDPDWIELADAVDAYIGLESEPLRDKVIVSSWFEGNQEIVAGSGTRSALGVGVRTTGKRRFRAQVTAGLGGSAEDFSILAGFSYGVSTPTIGSPRIN